MGFLLLVYFSIPVGCELGSQSCKPGSLPKIPLFTGIPVGYGGIWWDSGEIWTGIPVGCVLGSRWDMDWDPGWMCTGIPVGCVLGSQWDMVGYGLGSQWMWTGIPTKNPSGIEGGIPVGSQSGSQFYFHWGRDNWQWLYGVMVRSSNQNSHDELSSLYNLMTFCFILKQIICILYEIRPY